jgi:D-beta-D-heptose 7-phosphate kinase/D-beta-D-heptose 1-phosphate adenosyltransferase
MDISNLTKEISELKILTLGDVMLDVYDFCYTASSRPSPEKPGRRVYKAEESLKRLGGAGNVAANLADLGVSSILISTCGNDGFGDTLRELSEKRNIHNIFIAEEGRISTLKTRLYIDDEYLLRRDDEVNSKISKESEESILSNFKREVKGANAVILSDYNKGFFNLSIAQEVIRTCNEKDIPVVVDFKPANKDLFKGATIVAPNLIEAQDIKPNFVVDENIERYSRELHELLGSKYLMVTLGSYGLCYNDGKNFQIIKAHKVKTVDSVGCGDTVRACLGLGLALGYSLEDACKLANAAAALVVQKIGTASITPAELNEFLKERGVY